MDNFEFKKVRWKQRFENFQKAFLFLEDSLKQKSYTNLEMSGVIKAFEMVFELSWNTLKDFLESEGVDVKFPRDVIKTAFKFGLIQDGHLWIEILDQRNRLTHSYDEETAKRNILDIKNKYFDALKQVYVLMQKKI